jgi:UDP-glucuronate 4-epimerase
MRIVVTGAGGFIGSHLCEALLDEGHEVIGIDGFIPSYRRDFKLRNLVELRGRPGFQLLQLDLRYADLEPVLEGADVVVNLAAMPGLPRSWTEMDLYVGCNLSAVERLIDASLRTGIGRFVQASTSSVCGRDAVGDETLPTRPISPYGITKLAAEHLILAHVESSGLPATILRYFSIYGPRQRPDMAYHLFTEALRAGRPIRVFGSGHQSRSNTYVADCVRGTVLGIQGGEVGEIYNIGGGHEIKLLDAVELLAEALGVRPVIEHLPPRAGDQWRTSADVSKARAAFGYEPMVTPAEGLASQVAWHLGQPTDRAELQLAGAVA